MSRSLDVKTSKPINSTKISASKNNYSELKSFHTNKSFNFASTKNTMSVKDKLMKTPNSSNQNLQERFPILCGNLKGQKN